MPSASAKRHSGVPSCATTTRAGLTSCSGRGQSLSAPHAARKRRNGAAASVIQQPRLVNKRGIYGRTISRSSAAPVARHWEHTLIPPSVAVPDYVPGVTARARYTSVTGWYSSTATAATKRSSRNSMCLILACCIWFSKFCTSPPLCSRLALPFARF